ncbi:YlxR family protein [Mycobacterium sp. 050134]|uniref:YlxR family protein n=1 Tax=Mycobacterium sp. 050134 TaxID=3096111 RepID=UPI002ED82CDF
MIQREPSAPRTSRAHRHPGGPVRTCVGCRKRELAVELLRVVAVPTGNGESAVIVDMERHEPGRGAWLHPAPGCVDQAVRRRAFTRALRIAGSPDTSAVVEHLEFLGAPEHPATEQVTKNMSTP